MKVCERWQLPQSRVKKNTRVDFPCAGITGLAAVFNQFSGAKDGISSAETIVKRTDQSSIFLFITVCRGNAKNITSAKTADDAVENEFAR